MSDLKLPQDDEKKKKKVVVSPARYVIWAIGGAAGLYVLLSGVIGLIQKG